MTSEDTVAAGYTVDDFVRADAATEPAFTADGSTLTFISNRSGVAQVYAVGIEGEAAAPARKLSDTEGLVYGAAMRPGGNDLLFVTDDGGDEQWQLNLVNTVSGQITIVGSEPGTIYNFGAWSDDGRLMSYVCNRRDRRYSDVYVYDVESGKERLVLQRDVFGIRAGGFTPDNSKVICTWPNLDVPGDDDLYLADIETGAVESITAHEGTAQWVISTGQHGPIASFVSPTVLLALSDEGREFVGLQRIDLASKQREMVLAPDWDVESFAISPDRGRIAIVVNEDGYSRLSVHELSADVRLGAVMTLELPAGVIAGVSWNADGSKVVFSFETPSHPSDIWLLDLATGASRPITQSKLAGLTPKDLPEPELVRYTSFDGMQIPAFFYRPTTPASDGPLPAMVLVHGGPESQSRPSLWGRYAAAAYLLARGDVCLLVPNVRGSTGYGKTYCHADDVEKRMDSVRDLAAGVDWLAGTGVVDPERIGVMGDSYGGFMTLAAITEYPELWAAAIDMFGIANWETFMEHTGVWRRAQRAREYGSDPAFLRTISPIHKADRITAPLFVIQGDHDVRVPPEESEQIAETVRRNEGIVEYVVYEREGHGIQRLPNRLAMNRQIVDFLGEHLIG
ncbi:MAG: prolyl oligopeptidase family serine peptidase [Dehalococcoidia bacterium]